ncbi:uncharacterized protein LOC9654959 isoform X2 [Selaginella moellendorffii]|uniref:uncharacterized protein LOC9654959 isoform X2 n=1 Tax=Selaginella moellendorffii TaxID=88036 RepID=UPI000D1CB798|nr:uncharacterized protein LOC9654959 isoform X2 [Selaginella moellendorffii]|eukprot:XP_024544401.1 uncharacterized protein LOC9654959 isoform X2 [Selaginella moellendorffii]
MAALSSSSSLLGTKLSDAAVHDLRCPRFAQLKFERISVTGRSSRRIKRSAQVIISCAGTYNASTVVEKIDFRKLQNGSDIRGVAVAGGEEAVNLTVDVAKAIGAAFAQWLADKKKESTSSALRVSIGHDSRISASSLEQAIAQGIVDTGLDVVLYGLASTPAMFNSTVTERGDLLCPADGAIMITASHLPYNRNGFKFFTNTGGLGKADISDILSRAAQIHSGSSWQGDVTSKDMKRVNYMDHYASDLVKIVQAAGGKERPLEGFHILVDAGNGAGGFFAEKVLKPLGADTTGSQFLEPDGMFPNHIPNPEDKKAMEAVTSAVLKHKADLGIIFDTDVDRSAAVDSSGRELNRNRLIALISAIVLAEHPGTTIVTDSITSDGLTEFIEKKLGGKHHRFKRGYKNVIDEGIRLNSVGEESHLAIETSGHGALKENRWLDDGAYLMVKLLIKLAAGKAAGEGEGSEVLTRLIESLEEAGFATEFRLKINESHQDVGSKTFREYGEEVLRRLEESLSSDSNLTKAPKNYEGVRVSGHGGWFLLRLSLHDPVLPLNIEAPTKDAAQKLGSFVMEVVSGFKALDVSSLQKFLT